MHLTPLRRGLLRWCLIPGQGLLHGHIEGYNLQGKHVGVFDVISGELIGPAVKGRRIDV
ncbi:colicin E3/pyocin S6 family cytotoxin [uncultured Corynebacterium sp.]|uniref:colicin E3/pyocin S6 family cytotoxin n=1 Tax=uncultured Corynebacterium sp. TaxID=159447 RepID=UPI0025CCCFA1|nr:colicin E3/pyocin S6 family cytotoxin [uncultured Corynebacterium sp.]